MSETLEILYRDDHLVAVNKPAGLLVHRSALDAERERFAVQLLRRQIKRRVYPVHRLDRPTSGVLLFGLHPEAARRLGADFAERQVTKTYLAVVRGYLPDEGVIDHPLQDADEPGTPPRPALTTYQRLARVELPIPVSRYPCARYSLARLRPHHGRRHQLRRHLKHIFHPIIGDTSHGRTEHNRLFRQRLDCHRLLLAAVELSFRHPWDDSTVTVTAPLDPDFVRVLEHLGWRDRVPPGWLPATA